MSNLITSTANETIKAIRKLKLKKNRDESGLFFVEGIRLVSDGFQSKNALKTIIFAPDLLDSSFGFKLVEEASERSNIEVLQVNADVFRTLSSKQNPQGLGAVAFQQYSSLKTITECPGIWIGLHDVQDPGNLGTILRSVDGAGGYGMLLIGNTVDPFHPTAVRASMGAIFSQYLIKISSEDFINWADSSGIPIIGTDCIQTENYKKYNYPQNMILLMGSEQKGLPQELKDSCAGLVHIPLHGQMDSLNLSNAASIILFEIADQKWL